MPDRNEPGGATPPDGQRRIVEVIESHYGGDVSRVIVGGVASIPGRSVRAVRDRLEAEWDGLRRLLLYPPYGVPEMCANLIVEPSHPEAVAGYVIMEAMGYPHFSGSNTICVVTALLESGRIPMERGGSQTVLLEAPAGLVRAEAQHDGHRVLSVTVECDPAYVVERGLTAELPGHGTVTFALVWSGCYYAVVDAAAHGFALTSAAQPALTGFAHDLCVAASPDLDLRHPEFGDTGGLSFVCIAGPLEDDRASGASGWRSATYVHPHVLCACPTGTGTAARLALLVADGHAGTGDSFVVTSPSGSSMTGRVVGSATVDGRDVVRTTVMGRAFVLGRNELLVNRDDDLVDVDGFWELLEDGPR